MFKLNIPVTVIVSSGSLALLVIASLLLVTNTAHTSDIKLSSNERNHRVISAGDESSIAAISSQTPSIGGAIEESTSQPTSSAIKNAAAINLPSPSEARRRSGRVFSGQQHESYAAAYAAANSPASADHHQSSGGLVQSTIQANDAINYASFGESLPSSSGGSPAASASSEARHGSDYAPANYYAGFINPSSSSSSSYSNGNQHSSSASNYHHIPSVHYYGSGNYHQKASSALPLGYPTNLGYERPPASSGYYDRSYPSASSYWASSGSGGLMSSASSALSHWTSGFTITEIICSLVAISIGAIILGAPFFLIYLALMGNFSGSGTLSLTNPSQTTPASGGTSTTVNGRRKRLAIFEQINDQQQRASEFGILADSVVRQLSPFVDLQQVSATFKRLVDSMEKYSQQNKNVRYGEKKRL